MRRPAQGVILLSPLSGIRDVRLIELSQYQYLLNRAGVSGAPVNPSDRFRTDLLDQIRTELQQGNPSGAETPGGNGANGGAGPNGQQPLPNNPLQLSHPVPQAFESPTNPALNNGQLSPAGIGAQPMQNQLQTGQGVQRVATTPFVTPSQQSPQYHQLWERLQRYEAEQSGTQPETPGAARTEPRVRAAAWSRSPARACPMGRSPPPRAPNPLRRRGRLRAWPPV